VVRRITLVIRRKRAAQKWDLHLTCCSICYRIMAISNGDDKTKLMRQEYKAHSQQCGFGNIVRWKV